MTIPHPNLAGLRSFPVAYLDDNFANLDARIAVLPNLIVNGGMDVAQVGTSLAAGTGKRYLIDQWYTSSLGTTLAPSQQGFTLGQTEVMGEPTFYQRVVAASAAGAGNWGQLAHPVESVRVGAGGSMTLTFYARADSAKNIAVEFQQSFGTGGAPSATVKSLGVATVALGTTFKQYSVTVSLPSIAGKVLGTNLDDALLVVFWMDAGSNFNAQTNALGQQSGTFDFYGAYLTYGSNPVTYVREDTVTMWERCYRYLWVTNVVVTGAAATAGGQSFYCPVKLPTRMRVAPGASSSFTLTNCTAFISGSGNDYIHITATSIGAGNVVAQYNTGNVIDARL